MKIKKYQNPSGTLTPEREAEIRAEQQAALDKLWDKRNAYAKQEEQERKQQLKEEIKRVTSEHAAKTAHLDNGSSATDWYYALQDDPQKRAEWNRGAKLTTKAGLSVATLPWTLTYGAKSLKNIYDLAKFGLTNPVGKTAAAKAFVSTLGGEAAYQLSEWEKAKLNNSRFGQTNINRYFAQPMLSAIGVIADPDMAMTHAATKQGAKMIGSGAGSLINSGTHFISPDANEVWDVGENFAKANVTEIDNMFKRNLKKGGDRSKALVKTGVDSFSPHFADQQTITLLDQARQKFGDDFLLEAIPANSEYFANFERSTREAAKEAFEREMLTGEGLIANGTLSRMSGEEIAQRGFAKQQGYGNNNIVLLRSAPRKETLTVGKTLENNAPIYSMLGDPGIVDKYVIAPRGTSMINLGIDHNSYMEKVARIQSIQNQYLAMFNKGLEEGSRDKAIKGFRGYMWAQQAMPSTMQHYNVLAGRHVVPDPNVKTQAVVDILNERARAVGQGITEQLDSAIDVINKREIGSIISGDAPILTTGLTREYKDLPEILRVGSKWEITGKNHTVGSYPIVMSDATEVMYVPHMKQVTDRLAPLMTDHLSTTQSHAANGFRSRIPLFTKIPRATPDNYVKAASEMFGPQMTDALVYNSIDSTAGAGLLPSVSIINPFDGKFKTLVVPFRPNGKFRATPGLKIGGIIPSYLKKFKGDN